MYYWLFSVNDKAKCPRKNSVCTTLLFVKLQELQVESFWCCYFWSVYSALFTVLWFI